LVWGCAMVLVIVTWWLASPFTIRHARLVQKIGQTVVGPLMAVSEWGNPRSQYTSPEISSYLWPNGTLPNSEEFDSFVKSDFVEYRLRVSGLVEKPKTFSYAELKAMPQQEQITEHFCIQGWSGVAKWGGIPMRHILDIIKPTADARYACLLFALRRLGRRRLLRRSQDVKHLPDLQLTLLVGQYAHRHYLTAGRKSSVTETVRFFFTVRP
jgi:sulfoxide reductase catalytic subunit YedY